MSSSTTFLTGKELRVVQRLYHLMLWGLLSPQDGSAVLPDVASLTRRQLLPLHDRTKLMMFRVVMSTQVVLEAHHRRHVAVVQESTRTLAREVLELVLYGQLTKGKTSVKVLHRVHTSVRCWLNELRRPCMRGVLHKLRG